MKTLMILIAVFCSFGLLFTEGISYAQFNPWIKEPMAVAYPQGIVGGGYPQRGWDTFEASWLIGYRVYSPTTQNFDLGQISNLVIDQSNDRIALVVLSSVPGFGAEKVAVPYHSIRRVGPNTFQLRIPPNKIGMEGYVENWDIYRNKYRDAMAPGVLPNAIDAKWVTNLYKEYDQFPYWIGKGEKPLTGFYMSSMLVGAKAQSPQTNKVLGEVNDLVIDSPNGRLVFAIVSGDSGKAAVPYSLLTRKGENTFVLNVSEAKLATAPSFNRYEDMGRRAYATNVYRYFGVEPFWTE